MKSINIYNNFIFHNENHEFAISLILLIHRSGYREFTNKISIFVG